jgi:hypothetical protein
MATPYKNEYQEANNGCDNGERWWFIKPQDVIPVWWGINKPGTLSWRTWQIQHFPVGGVYPDVYKRNNYLEWHQWGGQRLQTLILKLQSAHGKGSFEMFNEHHKCLKLKTFPKNASDVQKFLNSINISYDRKRNASFLIHVTSLIPFGTFKNKLFNCLYEYKVWMGMSIFRLSIVTMICISYLARVNQEVIYRMGYQDEKYW